MAANEGKQVFVSIVLTETAEHSEHPPRIARVDVRAASVAQALEMAKVRTMAQLKGKK